MAVPPEMGQLVDSVVLGELEPCWDIRFLPSWIFVDGTSSRCRATKIANQDLLFTGQALDEVSPKLQHFAPLF